MDYYGASDKGLKRKINEDSYCCMLNKNGDFFACVCDGIGGAAAGEVASKMAVIYLQECFQKAMPFKSEPEIVDWIKHVVEEANDQVFNRCYAKCQTKGHGNDLCWNLVQ